MLDVSNKNLKPMNELDKLKQEIEELKGKLTGMSFRVPVANVSVVDLTVNLATSTSYKEICETFKSASESERMKGILGYSEDELVSSDIISDKRISIIYASAGIELNDKFMNIKISKYQKMDRTDNPPKRKLLM